MLDSISLVVLIVAGAFIIGMTAVYAFRKDSETGFAILAFAALGIIPMAVKSGEEIGNWMRIVVLLACASGATILYLITRKQKA